MWIGIYSCRVAMASACPCWRSAGRMAAWLSCRGCHHGWRGRGWRTGCGEQACRLRRLRTGPIQRSGPPMSPLPHPLLHPLLRQAGVAVPPGLPNPQVRDVSCDSRRIAPGLIVSRNRLFGSMAAVRGLSSRRTVWFSPTIIVLLIASRTFPAPETIFWRTAFLQPPARRSGSVPAGRRPFFSRSPMSRSG